MNDRYFALYEECRADNTAHFRKIMEQQKQIEKLEAENKVNDSTIDILIGRINQLKAENKILMQALAKIADMSYPASLGWGGYAKQAIEQVNRIKNGI